MHTGRNTTKTGLPTDIQACRQTTKTGMHAVHKQIQNDDRHAHWHTGSQIVSRYEGRYKRQLRQAVDKRKYKNTNMHNKGVN